MKTKLFLASLAGASFVLSCTSDDTSTQLSDVARYIQTVQFIDTDNTTNETVTVNYDSNGRVSGVTDGTESSSFVYDGNDNLTTISGDDEPLSMSELYQAPYDGYEFGEVLQYDSNGNPTELRLFERDSDGSIVAEYTSEISYDSETNPFLHTLENAGILEVLDNIELNFSTTPTSQELITAKLLLPVNNPNHFVIKTLSGQIRTEVVASYVYNTDGYPTSATFTTTTDNDISVTAATYTYLP